jgi:hypothetical protein
MLLRLLQLRTHRQQFPPRGSPARQEQCLSSKMARCLRWFLSPTVLSVLLLLQALHTALGLSSLEAVGVELREACRHSLPYHPPALVLLSLHPTQVLRSCPHESHPHVVCVEFLFKRILHLCNSESNKSHVPFCIAQARPNGAHWRKSSSCLWWSFNV